MAPGGVALPLDRHRTRPLPAPTGGRPDARAWFVGLLFGGLAGAVMLGAGGRLAMRGIAIAQEWTLSFSIAGSLTVVWMGAVAGTAGAAIALTLQSVPRLPRWARGVLFWAAAVLLALRILSPVDADRVVMFTPCVLAYGLTLRLGLARLMRTAGPRPSRS